MAKYKTTIILVLIFLGILAFYILYEKDRTVKTEDEVEMFKVWDVNQDDVNGLIFEHDEMLIDVAKNDDGNWEIINPEQTDADNEKLDNLVDEVASIETDQEIEFENLADFGLEESKAKVIVKFSDGSNKDVSFGDTNPDDTKVYGKVSDKDKIFLTDISVFNELKPSIDDLKKSEEENEEEGHSEE